jgi:hypothetical protein
MTTNETATQKYALGRPTSDEVGSAMPVLAAVWCRSVGSSWTLELYELDGGTARGPVVDWISSGVPISQPEPPEALARELLAERGLTLFDDCTAGPCTLNRRGVGYVATDAELITLAHLVADEATETGRHPVMLAAQWIAAGFSADEATGWISQGVHCPQAAEHQMMFSQPTVSPTTRWATVASPDPSGDAGHSLGADRIVAAMSTVRAEPLPRSGDDQPSQHKWRSAAGPPAHNKSISSAVLPKKVSTGHGETVTHCR